MENPKEKNNLNPTISTVEIISDSPERESLLDRLRGPMGRHVLEMAGVVLSQAVESANEIKERAGVIAGNVSDKVIEGYDIVSDKAQEVWDEHGDQVIDVAKNVYGEVVVPVAVDMLKEAGGQFGVEVKKGKLDIKVGKLARGAIRAWKNPTVLLGVAKDAAQVGIATAKKSAGKMVIQTALRQ